jgi:hypothetical protein
MNGHGKVASILSAVIQSDSPCQIWHGVFEPSPSEKALKIGADLVRQVFGYFEFDFRISGIHLDDSGQRLF